MQALIYLTVIICFLYILQSSIFHRLLLLSDDRSVAVKRKPKLPLQFKSDGRFKILQVADMHFGNGLVSRCRDVLPSQFHHCSDLNTTSFLKRVIEEEHPDFVAFTGDNIFGTSVADAAESLHKAMGPVMRSEIPWAAILGNHDQESTLNREELMSYISLMDYSLSQTYPSVGKPTNSKGRRYIEDIDGYGNYDLQVYGAPGSQLANSSIFNLFFLDSGDRAIVNGMRTYGWIKDSQLRWLKEISYELEVTTYQGKHSGMHLSADAVAAVPSLAFFHIPIPEVRHLFYRKIIGQFQEGVACSFVNSGVLQTLLSLGHVKAVFMGHDHKNDFCGELDGIWFCYGGGFGYHGYGKAGWPRRARVIMAELGKGENGWEGVATIRTWKRLDDESMSEIDEQVLWEKSPS